MTELEKKLEEIEILKKELDEFRPIEPTRLQKIWQKFRLDWNYHSNSIEGNRLDYGETKLFLLHGLTAKGKPLKDHLDLKNHNEALLYIEDLLRREDGLNRPLTQNFIRELHTIILKEEYTVDVEDPLGHKQRKTIRIGQYKETPNHVKTKTREMFFFAEPRDVQREMTDLLDWYHKSLEENLPIVVIAAQFHYKFVRIHPFDDGNGRLARILMNLILMKHGYVPVIIRQEKKDAYYLALQQADAGDIEPFILYICDELKRSLQLAIRGAKGDNIEEPDDFDKRMALLRMKLKGFQTERISLKKNEETLTKVFSESIIPLFAHLIEKFSRFNQFYAESEATIQGVRNIPNINLFDKLSQGNFSQYLSQYLLNNIDKSSLYQMSLHFYWQALIYSGTSVYDHSVNVSIEFQEYKYRISSDYFEKNITEKLYHQILTQDEIDELTLKIADNIFRQIESRLNL